jgi:hypothetical protein
VPGRSANRWRATRCAPLTKGRGPLFHRAASLFLSLMGLWEITPVLDTEDGRLHAPHDIGAWTTSLRDHQEYAVYGKISISHTFRSHHARFNSFNATRAYSKEYQIPRVKHSGTPAAIMTILILNPNTTQAMTDGVKDSIKLLGYEVQYACRHDSTCMTNRHWPECCILHSTFRRAIHQQ